MKIPVDPEHTPELMAVIERQQAERRPTCPFIFHGRNCGAPRFDRDGKRRPCLGDFQKVWDHACAAMGMASRIPHDLRRSGVKHYIDAGVDPYTVMRWSGHRTESMLQRYHIVDLYDLRRAGRRRVTTGGRSGTSSRAILGEPPQNRPRTTEIQGPRRRRRLAE